MPTSPDWFERRIRLLPSELFTHTAEAIERYNSLMTQPIPSEDDLLTSSGHCTGDGCPICSGFHADLNQTHRQSGDRPLNTPAVPARYDPAGRNDLPSIRNGNYRIQWDDHDEYITLLTVQAGNLIDQRIMRQVQDSIGFASLQRDGGVWLWRRYANERGMTRHRGLQAAFSMLHLFEGRQGRPCRIGERPEFNFRSGGRLFQGRISLTSGRCLHCNSVLDITDFDSRGNRLHGNFSLCGACLNTLRQRSGATALYRSQRNLRAHYEHSRGRPLDDNGTVEAEIPVRPPATNPNPPTPVMSAINPSMVL